MTFATTTNIITIILCAAVLVQASRMMRQLAQLKAVDMPAITRTLDESTARAQAVVSELRTVLAQDADPSVRSLAEARTIRDELEVMVGIANATADRLVETAASARAAWAEEQQA